jgi:succinate-acetate transporter protein
MTTEVLAHEEATSVATPDPGWAGNPMVLGLAGFTLGSLALALQLSGYVSAGAIGAGVPIILTASGISAWVTTVWAAKLGQNAIAAVFGIFAGFWISYALLVFALLHNWLVLPANDVTHTVAMFLITWLVVIVVLTVATLRLPSSLTAALVLVDAALLFDLIGTLHSSPGMTKLAGYCAFGFAAIGAYLLFGSLREATGGSNVAAGTPLVNG